MLSKEKLPGFDLTIFHPPSELTVSCESLNSSARGIPGKLRRINSGKTSSSGAGVAFDRSLRVVCVSDSDSFFDACLCGAAPPPAGGGGGASSTQVTEPEPVWLAAAEFIVRNRITRWPMPGLSKIVSLFRIIVIPAATIPTATKKTARRIIKPSKRRKIGMKIITARTTTAMTISGVVKIIRYKIPRGNRYLFVGRWRKGRQIYWRGWGRGNLTVGLQQVVLGKARDRSAIAD